MLVPWLAALVTGCAGTKSEHQKYQEANIDHNNPSAVEHYGRGSILSELSSEARSFPSSSTEDLMILYDKEKHLIKHINKVNYKIKTLPVQYNTSIVYCRTVPLYQHCTVLYHYPGHQYRTVLAVLSTVLSTDK